MKKFLKIGIAAALLLSTASVFANDGDLKLKVKGEKEKFIRFSIDKANDVNLSLVASDNEVVFQEQIHADAATSRVYDLNALPDGNYFLKLESDSTLTEYKVAIKDGETIVSDPSVRETFKPVLKRVGDEIVLEVENKNQEPIEVQIYNEYNDGMYTDVFKNKSKFTKKFNVSQTDAESLTFIVKVAKQRYVKTISLR
ncbi:hypothetical protein ACJVDH_14485 [Pedobacter sp. AW1-32]|uniref:hypothetical protein n=1 Tax=Pedobacter sp. AW1-32 TaxID=3383026 RepID=UPI003FEEA1C6